MQLAKSTSILSPLTSTLAHCLGNLMDSHGSEKRKRDEDKSGLILSIAPLEHHGRLSKTQKLTQEPSIRRNTLLTSSSSSQRQLGNAERPSMLPAVRTVAHHPESIAANMLLNECSLYGCTVEADCKAAFKTKSDWERHERTVHFPQYIWACGERQCEETKIAQSIKRRDHLQDHYKTKHPNKDLSKVNLHDYRKSSNNFPQSCFAPDCGKKFESWSDRVKHVFPTHLEPRNLGVGLPTPESSKSDDHSSSPTNSISPAVYITRSQETSEQANDRAPCAGSVAAQPDHMGNEDIPEVNDDPQEELQADSNHPVRSEQEIDSDDNKSQQYNESQDHGTSLYVEDQAIYSDNGSPTDMATYSDYAPSLLAEERTFNQTVTSDSEEDSRKSSSEDTESTLSSSESYGGNGGDGGSGGAGASGSNNDPTFPPQWRGFDGGLSTNQNERRNGGGDMHLHRDAPMPFPMWRLKLPFMMQRYLAQAKRDEQWSLIESGAETWRPKVPPVISVKAASTENGITATGFSTSRRRSRVCKLEK